MNKSEILRLGQSKIDAGKTRQITFEELQEETQIPIKDLVEIVRALPPSKTMKKFKPLIYILIGLLSTIVIIRTGRTIILELDWLTMSTIVSGLNLVLVIALMRGNTDSLKIAALVSALTLFGGFPGVFKTPIDYSNLLLFIVTAITIGLSYFIFKKLVTSYSTKREFYTNDLGQQRGRDVIYFED